MVEEFQTCSTLHLPASQHVITRTSSTASSYFSISTPSSGYNLRFLMCRIAQVWYAVSHDRSPIDGGHRVVSAASIQQLILRPITQR